MYVLYISITSLVVIVLSNIFFIHTLLQQIQEIKEYKIPSSNDFSKEDVERQEQVLDSQFEDIIHLDFQSFLNPESKIRRKEHLKETNTNIRKMGEKLKSLNNNIPVLKALKSNAKMDENFGEAMKLQQDIEQSNLQVTETIQNLMKQMEERFKYMYDFSAEEVRDISRSTQIEYIRKIVKKNENVLTNAVSFFRRMTVVAMSHDIGGSQMEVTVQHNLKAIIQSVLKNSTKGTTCQPTQCDAGFHVHGSNEATAVELVRRISERQIFLGYLYSIERSKREYPTLFRNMFMDEFPTNINDSDALAVQLQNTKFFMADGDIGPSNVIGNVCHKCFKSVSRESLLLLSDDEYKEVFKKEHFVPTYEGIDIDILGEETIERNDFLWVIANHNLQKYFLTYLWQMGFHVRIELVSLEAEYPTDLAQYTTNIKYIETFVPKYKFVWEVGQVVGNEDWVKLMNEQNSDRMIRLTELLSEGEELRFTQSEFFYEERINFI